MLIIGVPSISRTDFNNDEFGIFDVVKVYLQAELKSDMDFGHGLCDFDSAMI